MDPNSPPSSAEVQLRLQRRYLLFGIVGVLLLAAAGGAAWMYYDSGASDRAGYNVQTAASLMAPGHYQEAVVAFDRILKDAPTVKGVYLKRAVAYQNLGQVDKALADFDNAAVENPREPSIYSARAAIYRGKGDYPRALAELSKGLQMQDDAGVHFERAETYEQLGRHKEAIQDLDVVIAVLGDAPHALRLRGLIEQRLGDKAGSDADFIAAKASEKRAHAEVRQ